MHYTKYAGYSVPMLLFTALTNSVYTTYVYYSLLFLTIQLKYKLALLAMLRWLRSAKQQQIYTEM